MALRAVRLIAERQHALLVVVTTSGRVRAKGAQERPGQKSLGGIDRASRLNPTGASSDLDVLRLGVGMHRASTVRRWPIASASGVATC
jgi:hypothetical protein